MYNKLTSAIRITAIILSLFVLAACDGIGDWGKDCITGNDFGQLQDYKFSMNANSSNWIDTGITIRKGAPLTIETNGNINLCDNASFTFVPDARKAGWQDTGATFTEGETYKIEVIDGWYNRWKQDYGDYCSVENHILGNPLFDCQADKTERNLPYCILTGDPHLVTVDNLFTGRIHYHGITGDRALPDSNLRISPSNCSSSEGKGLFAYIGINPSETDGASINGNTTLGYSNSPYRTSDNLPYFFELYDYAKRKKGVYTDESEYLPDPGSLPPGYNLEDIKNSVGGNLFDYLDQVQVPQAGKLYFKYHDSANYSDNRGQVYNQNNPSAPVGYSLKITRNCFGERGMYMAGYIGSTPPIGNINPADPKIINLHQAAFNVSSDKSSFVGIYDDEAAESGTLWLKVIDDRNTDWNQDGIPDNKIDGNYSNNSGSYDVSVTVPKDPETATKIIKTIVDPIKFVLVGDPEDPNSVGMAEKIFTNITGGNDHRYLNAIRAAMALAIVLMALGYLVGTVNVTQKEVVVLAVKLGIMQQLISPGAWEFFYNNLFVLFVEGLDDLIWRVSGFVGDVLSNADLGGMVGTAGEERVVDTNTFGFLDQTIGLIYTKETFAKIFALFSPHALNFGFVYGALIIFSIIVYTFAIGKAIFMYVLSLIMIAVSLTLAPIFIPFMLFKRTESLFENWWKYTAAFMIQPVLLFTLLPIFSIFIYSIFFKLLAFPVCWDNCAGEIDIQATEYIEQVIPGLPEMPELDTICFFSGYVPWGMDNPALPSDDQIANVIGNFTESEKNVIAKGASFPVELMSLLSFMILVVTLYKFIDWIGQVANQLVVGPRGISMQSSASKGTSQAYNTARTAAKGAAMYGTSALGAGHKLAKEGRQMIKQGPGAYIGGKYKAWDEQFGKGKGKGGKGGRGGGDDAEGRRLRDARENENTRREEADRQIEEARQRYEQANDEIHNLDERRDAIERDMRSLSNQPQTAEEAQEKARQEIKYKQDLAAIQRQQEERREEATQRRAEYEEKQQQENDRRQEFDYRQNLEEQRYMREQQQQMQEEQQRAAETKSTEEVKKSVEPAAPKESSTSGKTKDQIDRQNAKFANDGEE